MLKIGDTAPDFSLPDHEGHTVSLDDLLKENSLILYFYPADFTPGCTAEACSIRDMHSSISSSGMEVAGISPQGIDSHSRFREAYSLNYPLLSDRNKKIIRAYGVDGPLGLGVRRVTYLIGQNKVIKNRMVADFMIQKHTDFVKDAIAAEDS